MLNGQSLLLNSFGLDITKLKKQYCPNGETFIAKMPLPDFLTGRLFSFFKQKNKMNTVSLKTGTIDLFAWLLCGRPEVETDQIVYYTRSQVEIAKRIETIITDDFSKQHTVHEFAEMFSVSESSVKNYFHGVFGQSISQYTMHRRMMYGAELITSTHLPVIDIAGMVGYESQSKFSAAFRRKFGVPPLEYRRSQNIPINVK